MSETLYDSFLIFMFFFMPVLVILIFVKRRRQKAQLQTITDGTVRETSEDLAKAEDALRKLPIDIRETLIETHELYDRFSTHRGYSNAYIEALTRKIRDEGIGCDLVFQATLPMGMADAIVEPQGVYELYVRRDQIDLARKRIPEILKDEETAFDEKK